jgi:hypothetical protein
VSFASVRAFWSGASVRRRYDAQRACFGNDSSLAVSKKPELISLEACRRIWAHVLLNALRECNHPTQCVTAKAWIFSSRQGVGSLRWICDHLDLDFYEIQTLAMTREGRARLMGRHY